MNHLLRLLSVLLIVLLSLSGIAFGQLTDEEDDFPPGLLARYTVGEESLERIDPDIAFNWSTAAPDQRLPTGNFTAQWQSLLLVRQAATYRLHAHLQGEVEVVIQGKPVLKGDANEGGWISGQPFSMNFGDKEFAVRYRKTGKSALLKLYWSSDAFALEPIPASLFFREEGRPDLGLAAQGRIQSVAARCNRCHQQEGHVLSPPAPDLRYASLLSRQWIARKLTSRPSQEETQMPTFGFSQAEAAAIAAFLQSRTEQVELKAIQQGKPEEREKDLQAGKLLFLTTGCLACHTAGKLGTEEPFGGGDLTHIGEKRTPEYFVAWLTNPATLNRDHRMPTFNLSGTERRQLAFYLSTLIEAPENSAVTVRDLNDVTLSVIEQGEQLVKQARCTACHRIPNVDAPTTLPASLTKDKLASSNSCLTEQPNRDKWRPAYERVNADAIKAHLATQPDIPSPEGDFAKGRRLLEQRNCINCHERDGYKGIRDYVGQIARADDRLTGQSEGLIPPALTAVGDKLLDAPLAEAVGGDQKKVRLPWLGVRMPRFQHTQEERAALAHYLVEHDRIPDNPPAESLQNSNNSESNQPDDAQLLVVGHTLIGPKGFSCVACHKVGEFEPRNVALGTRGSDLMAMQGRMRPEYFIRWTRSPLRIVPGMEMPSYVRAVPGILGDDVNRQLEAMWNALNDPRFKAPTNPSSVEQYFVVEKGQPARIVRDVFTNPKENGGGYIARSFAVGLENGHNVLFDLDTGGLRQWYFGDFARQRTVGKSWYWDLAGVSVFHGFGTEADLALQLRDNEEAKLIEPLHEHGTTSRLLHYHAADTGVEFAYELAFNLDGKRQRIVITEQVAPLTDPDHASRAGWSRRIEATSVPPKYNLVVSWPDFKGGLGNPSANVVGEAMLIGNSAVFDKGQTSDTVTLGYFCDLQREPGELKEKPAVPVVVETVDTVPGFLGTRLPIDRSIMPTAMTWRPDGSLAFTSLKGHVYLAQDTNDDGIEDQLTQFEEGLAAPYGILADGDDILVAHKPELLRLIGSNHVVQREVAATGWGYNDNYHDWTCGIVRDAMGRFYIGLGSDYAQSNRPPDQARWRGKVLRVETDGSITPVGHAFRYPTGLAINEEGEIFVTDNQGVQNTFNELNHLIEGKHYGVPSRYEEQADAAETTPAIQIPHPWSRSVNGIFFLPKSFEPAAFAGHAIGCEYDSRFLVRFSFQQVGDVIQGATYYFSKPNAGTGKNNFLGPLSGTVNSRGEIYIGSILDSGWLGGQNTGSIVQLKPHGPLPNGIRELRATPDGFEIEMIHEANRTTAETRENYTISGYTRIWKGGYSTPDSGRYRVNVKSASLSADGKTVTLVVDRLQEGFVYEVTCENISLNEAEELWPATGHYTMKRIPAK